jgi:DNA repair ATPase RecN
MKHDARKIGQEILAEMDRHISVLATTIDREKKIVASITDKGKKVDKNEQKSQQLLLKFRHYLAESEGRERGRRELSDRLKAIMDAEEKLEERQRKLTEKKQELLTYAQSINKMLRGGI